MNQKYKALREGNWIDFFQNDNPVCPHCGTEVSIHENELWRLYNDNEDHQVDCDSCSKKFTVKVEATYTFSTNDQDDMYDDDDDHEGTEAETH